MDIDTYLTNLSDNLKGATSKQQDKLLAKAESVLNILKYEILIMLKDYDYIDCLYCNNYYSANNLIELSIGEYMCHECANE